MTTNNAMCERKVLTPDAIWQLDIASIGVQTNDEAEKAIYHIGWIDVATKAVVCMGITDVLKPAYALDMLEALAVKHQRSPQAVRVNCSQTWQRIFQSPQVREKLNAMGIDVLTQAASHACSGVLDEVITRQYGAHPTQTAH